jgi:hypothetical protein
MSHGADKIVMNHGKCSHFQYIVVKPKHLNYMIEIQNLKLQVRYITDRWNTRVYDSIILLIGEVWAHKTKITPPLFIEVPVPMQVSE